ncbi:transporter [Mycobacterium asiaticum]|uniref:Transporter n=1 Tax=Mycobacterium asiaticum TaxID=1790 RepID=A0A1A3PBG4_MYCAS|nr:RND family transporter [Mycobacterium asiaticum]OBK31568.1 transporter [Mycobacterium asiaticum]
MIGRFIYRFALLIVGIWAVVAVAGNSLAPQLEGVVADKDQPFLPTGTATSLAVQRSAEAFSQTPTDNVGYLVLERHGPLTDQDRVFYDKLVTALRADPQHIFEVADWWQLPALSHVAQSDDRHVVTAGLRLYGTVGSTEAVDSIMAARNAVAKLHPPEGLHVYVTGPGATIMDEFAEIDRQMQLITEFIMAVLLILLVIIFRSPISALVPLVSVMLALAVAKPIIAVLAANELIGVSLFAIAVSVAVSVGAGTSFGIFLIGRYHERRRQDLDPVAALADAYRGVAPAIIGSTLIVVAPLGAVGWLSLARISMFATTGVLCAIGMLAVGVAALTLTPALIALASRADLLKPPRRKNVRRQWRRIGTHVARWPAPILVATGVFVLIMLIALPGVPIGWDERTSTSPASEANRGYRAVDEHFGPNQLQPGVVTIEADHDLRTVAGLSALERVTAAIMGISGVRMVQSASHPAGMVSKQAALSATGGNIGDRLDEFADQLAARPAAIGNLDAAVGDLLNGLDLIQTGMQAGSYALGGVSLAVNLTQQATVKVRTRAGDVSEIFDPLRSFVRVIADCPNTPVCSSAQEAVQWATGVVDGSGKLVDAVEQLAQSTVNAAAGVQAPDLPALLAKVSTEIDQVRGLAAGLREVLKNPRPVPTAELPDYLHKLVAVSEGGVGTDLYSSRQILTDPTLRPVLSQFFSPNGHATRLFVYGNGSEWGNDGAVRARAIVAAVGDATKDSTLKPTAVELTGVGPATRDLQDIVASDLTLLVLITLGVVLVVCAVVLRSTLAGLVVLGTIAASYVCALGASVFIWHRLLHQELHWSVAPIAFVSMVGIASGGNLLFAMRIREELTDGMRTSIIRAFAATGAIVTAGGVAVGITMLPLTSSDVLSVSQIGVTVGLGLLLNALVVRAFVLPAMMVVLDRWLWWRRPEVSDDEQEELEPVTATT